MLENPTTHPEANKILQILLENIQTILGDQFVGMYLFGSLAIGDFDPSKSDIDILVVTKDKLQDDKLDNLQTMHAKLVKADSYLPTQIECSYIPVDSLRKYDPKDAIHPHIDRGESELKMEQHDYDWVVQRHVLLEHGITVEGPPIDTLIDPITKEELQHALQWLLKEWWATMLKDSTPLQKAGYQVYAVQSMCRILYTFENNTVVSKPVACRWALDKLDKDWANLINQALGWKNNDPFNHLEETQDFIKYTLQATGTI